MDKVGILIISYGAREVAMIDAFSRSTNYQVRLYVVDKQLNPFNLEKAFKHVVIPDLNLSEIYKFAKINRKGIDFGIVGSEKPIIEGIRDIFEKELNISVICPKKKYAIESSKIKQRLLFEEIIPETNPRFKIFNPKDYSNKIETRKEVYRWLDELNNNAVVKPDKPAAGKGVGVWGDHFLNRDQLFEHFLSNFKHGPVLIEEKIDGEESSFQAFCDGKQLIPLPDVRDFKRAFVGDKGPNTGGMGAYKNFDDVLPFMSRSDREKEIRIVNKLFNKWNVENKKDLIGIPFYLAFIHTGKELKILENNSRPGDPEIINILPILKDDFVDICYKTLEGNLNSIQIENMATVVTYKVPSSYGGYDKIFPQLVTEHEVGKQVDLKQVYLLNKKYRDNIRVYPASMEIKNDKIYALKSRAICVVGIGENIEEARKISFNGIKNINGGALWYREDIASKKQIRKSIQHMKELRKKS